MCFYRLETLVESTRITTPLASGLLYFDNGQTLYSWLPPLVPISSINNKSGHEKNKQISARVDIERLSIQR